MNILTGIGNQYVFGFEISVVNSQTVAVFHGIQYLEKGPLDKSIIADIPPFFRDIGEEVPFSAIFQDNIGAVLVIDNFEHGHYVRVGGCSIMELDLP